MGTQEKMNNKYTPVCSHIISLKTSFVILSDFHILENML